MVFLIFIATFVTLACLVVPVATLAVFTAIERWDQVPAAPSAPLDSDARRTQQRPAEAGRHAGEEAAAARTSPPAPVRAEPERPAPRRTRETVVT